MMKLFFRDPVARMAAYRDRADRTAIAFLEGHAVKGTITRQLVHRVAEAVAREPRELVSMVPDRRRARRYEKALAGLRTAGLIGPHPDHDGD